MVLALLAAATLAGGGRPALAQEASPLGVSLAERKGVVTVDFDVTTALTDAFRRRLVNGLTSRVVMEMRLIGPDDRPIARTSRRCNFQFDIWDEVLEVRIREGNQDRRAVRRKLIDRGLRDCGQVTAAKLVNRSVLVQRSGYVLEVLVQLNPVSDEQLQRARQFMSNPRSHGGGRSVSFWASVRGLFGSSDEQRDDEFLFRSSTLRRPTWRKR